MRVTPGGGFDGYDEGSSVILAPGTVGYMAKLRPTENVTVESGDGTPSGGVTQLLLGAVASGKSFRSIVIVGTRDSHGGPTGNNF
jgi:hypothetical protein